MIVEFELNSTQSRDRPSLLAKILSAGLPISRLLDRSKSISDSVNIRGVGDMPSFRVSAAAEGVSDAPLPTLLEGRSVLLSELMKLLAAASPHLPAKRPPGAQ